METEESKTNFYQQNIYPFLLHTKQITDVKGDHQMYFTMFMIFIMMTSFEMESNGNYTLQLLVHCRPPSVPKGIRKMLPLHQVHEKQATCQTNCSFSHCKAADFLCPAQQIVKTQDTAAVYPTEQPSLCPFHLATLTAPLFLQASPQGACCGGSQAHGMCGGAGCSPLLPHLLRELKHHRA